MKVFTPDWELLRDLAKPFPSVFIKKAPAGKHGTYINHADITQRLLAVHGLYSFEVGEIIRGLAPEVKGSEKTWESRENAIVGCLGTLTLTDAYGNRHVITEVGTEDNPAMSNDAENLKNAASDAFKRCAMRVGLGLELWAKEGYHLPGQLDKHFPKEGPKPEGETAADF